MREEAIDFIIWLTIIAVLFTYAGYNRGCGKGFEVGYETGHEIASNNPNTPKTFNIWQ